MMKAPPNPSFAVPAGTPAGIDTATLAAHDFDVDTRTGFMPPQSPVARLPAAWDTWETVLDDALSSMLQLGDKPNLTPSEAHNSERWRLTVRQMVLLDMKNLQTSEVLLRRAHLVLSWIMHFYIHSLPVHEPIIIPRTISLPHLQVCAQLDVPPVLTFSDTVLYNWDLKELTEAPVPALNNLRSQVLFTGTNDEQEFYLASARIELRGVEALELMRATMDEIFVGDEIASRRITGYLHQMATVISDLRILLKSVRESCDPNVFYHDIRPWFKGQDCDATGRKWVFEGLEEDHTLQQPIELSGPSAGQSSLIHAIHIFLGIGQYIPSAEGAASKPSFMKRMQTYMPRRHRQFLDHLSANPRPLRSVVTSADDADLLEAYNGAVQSLKEFRDAHIIISALYIVTPARRHAEALAKQQGAQQSRTEPLKGTGGSDLIKFLKGTRDITAQTIISAV